MRRVGPVAVTRSGRWDEAPQTRLAPRPIAATCRGSLLGWPRLGRCWPGRCWPAPRPPSRQRGTERRQGLPPPTFPAGPRTGLPPPGRRCWPPAPSWSAGTPRPGGNSAPTRPPSPSGPADEAVLRALLEARLEPVALGTGLLTGYHEPALRGALAPGGAFRTPLRAPPPGLVPGMRLPERAAIEEGRWTGSGADRLGGRPGGRLLPADPGLRPHPAAGWQGAAARLRRPQRPALPRRSGGC